MNSKPAITVNGREYRWPDNPVVVVCVDGSEPDYIERAIEHSPAVKADSSMYPEIRVSFPIMI